MKTWFVRATITLLAVLVAAGLTYHLALRGWCLRWGTTPAEVNATLPGDDLFPVFAGEATHAITIQAPPEQVWPWLMQIGQDRSGFYSYTSLENLVGCDMPKAEHLVPEWKPRAVGETVWFATPRRFSLRVSMIAAVVQPQRSFVMVSSTDWERLQAGRLAREGFWSFTLEPLGNGQSRLIARLRRRNAAPTLASRAVGRLFWEPMHFVMEQKMLRTIEIWHSVDSSSAGCPTPSRIRRWEGKPLQAFPFANHRRESSTPLSSRAKSRDLPFPADAPS